jgi:hypothetical protein
VENVNQAGGVSVGRIRNLWLEVMFYLSLFFGALHFAGILGQVAGMVMHAALHREPGFALTSSMLMGHLYLTFLAAYVGPKEFVRWFRLTDDEVLSAAESRKITRGIYIVVGWAVFTGLVVLLKNMSLVAEVPETLLYTLGEVVALLCGTEASKYLRTRQAARGRQDAATRADCGDRVLDYARAHGSLDRLECQNECGLTEDQAYRLLKKLVAEKKLVEFGENKNRRYKLP